MLEVLKLVPPVHLQNLKVPPVLTLQQKFLFLKFTSYQYDGNKL